MDARVAGHVERREPGVAEQPGNIVEPVVAQIDLREARQTSHGPFVFDKVRGDVQGVQAREHFERLKVTNARAGEAEPRRR